MRKKVMKIKYTFILNFLQINHLQRGDAPILIFLPNP